MIIPRTPIGVLLVLATTVADDACRAQFEAIDDPICSNGRTFASWGDAWCAGATARWTRGACENDARVLAETPFGHDGGTHDTAHEGSVPENGYLVLVFLSVGLFLGLVSLFCINHFFPKTPYTLALFAWGMMLEAVHHHAAPRPLPLGALSKSLRAWGRIDPHLLLYAFLPILLFGDAMSVNTHLLWQKLPHVLILAGPGVVLGTFALAAFAYGCLPYDWPFAFCLVFGSILSATDPVAIVALLKNLGASPALTMVIMGESLFNDGTAAALFFLFLGVVVDGDSLEPGRVVRFCLRLAVGGPAIGVVFGFGTLFLLLLAVRRFEEVDTTLQVVTTIVSAYMSFFVAEHVCASSGILSCVFCGLVLARYAPPLLTNPHTIHTVWSTLEFVANTLIFLLSGVLAMKAIITNHSGVVLKRDLPVALAVYAALNASRALMLLVVWPAIAALEDPKTKGAGKFLSRKEGCVMAWGGLRGAISLALAIVVTHELVDHGEDTAKARRGAQLLFHVAVQAFLTLAVNGSTAGALLRALGLATPDARTLVVRRFVVTTVGHKCREMFDELRARSEGENDFDAAAVLKLCSVLRYRPSTPADGPPTPGSLRELRESSANDGLSYTTRLVASITEDDLLVAARTMFLHALTAEYWRLIQDGRLPEGSAVAEWLLSSTDLALDHAETALDDFSFLKKHCVVPDHKRAKAKHRCCDFKSAFPGAWNMIHLFFGVGPLGQLLRNVGDVGFGVQEQTYLCIHAFKRAHAKVVDDVCTHWHGMAAEYRHDTLEKVTEMLRAESARELAEAEAVLATMDPHVRRTMRTLLVSARVVSFQRAEVLSLAKKGLIPDSEREVLLHQVLADSHEIARHALDRRVEEHRRLALGGRVSVARDVGDDDSEHDEHAWIPPRHRLSRSDVSDALRQPPTPDPERA